jgi:hypothetical protein
MGVDVEIGIPITILLLPIGILVAYWWLNKPIRDLIESWERAGPEWTEKAQETHLVEKEVYKRQQLIQADVKPMDLDYRNTQLRQGITANGIKIDASGIYGVTSQKTVIGL